MSLRIPVWAANRERTRTPVMALAGGFTPAQTWQACARTCATHPFYVLGNPQWDEPGASGDNSSQGQLSLREYVFALDHTLASLHLEKVILVGCGLLGEIALAYAAIKGIAARQLATPRPAGPFKLDVHGWSAQLFTADNPVGALVLAGVSGVEPTLQQRSRWFEDVITLLSGDTAAATELMEDYLRAGLSPTTLAHSGCASLLRRWAHISDPGSAADLLRLQSARGNWVQAAGEISVPVTLLQGENDGETALAHAEVLAQQLCTTLTVVPTAASLLQVEQPQLLVQKIEQLSPFVS